VCLLKSAFHGFETLQLVDFDHDYPKYFDELFNQKTSLAGQWGEIKVYTSDEEPDFNLSGFGIRMLDIGKLRKRKSFRGMEN
jgi:hypothetical protein